MDGKPLSFPVYAYRWLTDEAAKAMGYEARGILFDLLCRQWIEGTIPLEAEKLGVILDRHSSAALAAALTAFVPDLDHPGRGYNAALRTMYHKQARKHKVFVDSGRKGGTAKGVNRRRQANERVEKPALPPSNLASGAPDRTEQPTLPGMELVVRPSAVAVKRLEVQNRTVDRRLKEKALGLAAQTIFEYWRDRMGFDPRRTILNPSRQARIIARLRENGGDVSEMLYVIDGALKNDWTMGRDPRSTKSYNGTQHIFRDREQVESLLSLVRHREPMHPYLSEHPDE